MPCTHVFLAEVLSASHLLYIQSASSDQLGISVTPAVVLAVTIAAVSAIIVVGLREASNGGCLRLLWHHFRSSHVVIVGVDVCGVVLPAS